MDIIQKFTQLPHIIEYEGILAELQLLRTSEKKNKLCYSITSVSKTSHHFDNWNKYGGIDNPFYENAFTGFLILCEGIENETDLFDAIAKTKKILLDYNIKF